MVLELLHPIPNIEKEHFFAQQLGGVLRKHVHELPSLEGVQVAFFSIENPKSLSNFRSYFYELFIGNWTNIQCADLGILFQGRTSSDTAQAVQEVVHYLLQKNIIPFVIGSTDEQTLHLYRAFDNLEQQVSLVRVGVNLGFSSKEELISQESYMSKIIAQEPTNLKYFEQVGYQTYYTPQEHLDLMKQLYFQAHRLGQVSPHIEAVEPVLRNANLFCFDMQAIANENLGISGGNPCGFSAKEACAIMRYAGFGVQMQAVGIQNIPQSEVSQKLIGMMLWYFLEGLNYRTIEYPSEASTNFLKYHVQVEGYNIPFYRSKLTGRWWMLSSNVAGVGSIACTEEEYLAAKNGIIPKSWWNLYQKYL